MGPYCMSNGLKMKTGVLKAIVVMASVAGRCGRFETVLVEASSASEPNRFSRNAIVSSFIDSFQSRNLWNAIQ